MADAAGPSDGQPPGGGKGNEAEREEGDEANAASTNLEEEEGEQQRVVCTIPTFMSYAASTSFIWLT